MDDSPSPSLLLEIWKNEALPLFPTYFEKVFEKKEETRNYNVKSPWFDCFQPFGVAEHKGDQIDGTIGCLLPAPRYFWDTWMAIYQLENPQVFYNPSVAAKSILEEIEILKLNPEGFINFEPFHEMHLQRTAFANRRNMFLDNPFSCVFAMRSAPMVEALRGNCDPFDFIQNNHKLRQELEKMEDAMLKDWKEKYPSFGKFLIKTN